ncbi:MAG: hypothetical protein DHS20C11_16470 [Lysobacteraceae bacterium]|nr:MAG: hypothetical protein DHS20C11_16470 [Xanthomonadaceae bacterium]
MNMPSLLLVFALSMALGYPAQIQAETDALDRAIGQAIAAPQEADYVELWELYLQSGRLSEVSALVAELPQINQADALSSDQCQEISTPLEQALKRHYVSFSLHYMSMICAQLNDAPEQAQQHENMLGYLAAAMTSGRDGTAKSPWRMGLFTDGAYFLKTAGIRPLDATFDLEDEQLRMVFVGLDEETGHQRSDLTFDAHPFFEAWKNHFSVSLMQRYGKAEAEFAIQQPWSLVAQELAEQQLRPFLTTIGLIGGTRDVGRRIAPLTQAANLGSPIAQVELANLMIMGYVRGSTEESVVDLANAAVEQGYAEAIVLLAWMHARGYGVDKDRDTAEALLRRAGDTQPPWTPEVEMAKRMLMTRYPVAMDFGRYNDWLEEPLEANNADAILAEASYLLFKNRKKALEMIADLPADKDRPTRGWLAAQALHDNRPEKAIPVKVLREESEVGHNEAAFILAEYLQRRKRPGARALMQQAAAANVSGSAFLLGQYYENGIDGPEDLAEALHWYRTSADRDHSYGLMKTGMLLLTDADSSDHAEALRMLDRAVERGNVLAEMNRFLWNVGEPFWAGDYNQAASQLEQGADDNDPVSLFGFGLMQLRGYRTEQDTKKALKHLEKAAKKGSKAAVEALAWAHMADALAPRRRGAEMDVTSSKFRSAQRQWLSESAQVGGTGNNVIQGILLTQDADSEGVDRGRSLLSAAANLGDAQAMFWLGKAATDLQEKHRWITQAAELGYEPAMAYLGEMLSTNTELKDLEAAAYWRLRSAVARDEFQDVADIAALFEASGEDLQRIVFWLRIAANAGAVEPALRLTDIYLSGSGEIEADIPEAVRFLGIAASRGDVDAMVRLAQIYETGLDPIDVNLFEARAWYEIAAEQGNVIAQTRAGWMKAAAEGGIREERIGRRMVQLAAKAGYAPAETMMGKMYETGIGQDRNPFRALKHYRLGAEAGDPDGMIAYARYLEKGIKIDPDPAEARAWLQKAAAAGSEEAQALLGDG